jgi:uncharacterized damage-inducible protein DinB
MKKLLAFTIALTLAPVAFAQGKAAPAKPDTMANPVSMVLGRSYDRVKKFIIGAADLMPVDQYSFKPTPEVRSFGQLIGHLADAQHMFCSAAAAAKPPADKKHESAEKLATKAELQKALKDAFAYCDKVYADATDAALTTQMVSLFGNQMPKFAALDINVAHDNEHYGNIVTYLRLKKLVPPSTASEK